MGHLAVAVATFVLPLPIPQSVMRPFDLNAEQGFGTLFSTLLLVATSLLLLLTGADARRRRAWDTRYWLVLAAGFAFMAVDESVSIHEMMQEPLRRVLDTSGALFYAWIIPYALIVLALAPFFLRFVRRLPPATRRDFVFAGGIYVTGAIGLELVEGRLQDVAGFVSFPMKLAFLAEEVMEMFGVAYFMAGILSHLETRGRPLQITVSVPTMLERDREVPLEQWQLADHPRDATTRPETTVRP